MRYQKPVPARFVSCVNTGVLRLRSSPRWGNLMNRRFTVITYTGRRSGGTFSTPVAYRRTGDVVTISVQLPERKKWWRNFTGEGGPISLELDGIQRTGHATARADEKNRVTVTVRLSGEDAAAR
ncbi:MULTISPECIES: nitroreductase/quinone reductase family protein [Amycolatopsis]|uniref:Deazaflavin-dependent oxidoreductase, nitroreductase family n=2 Tax=Amycolatopsis TaxID=1813 RepID=A0A1I3ZME3_9PSEU|nr:nitroreductase/quinone reductase family protein [Amycolatopsis sacchari]SFK44806.1 protein of unknown function [Amycolatopsis sacchari]